MKKTFFYLASVVLLTACNQNSETENLSEDNSTTSVSARRSCPSEEIRAELLKNDAGARQRFANIESSATAFQGKVLADGTVDIPVVVNVLYKTSAENISDARIAEQIAILNADFAGTNTDASKIPTEFSALKAGDTKVRFHLVKTVRKATTKTKWGTNDAMKKASSGGIDATTPTSYFNLWVVGNMGGNPWLCNVPRIIWTLERRCRDCHSLFWKNKRYISLQSWKNSHSRSWALSKLKTYLGRRSLW